MEVSIIGFGRFGQLMAVLLRDHAGAELNLSAASRSDRSARAAELGLQWQTVEAAAAADVVVLCVPIREFRGLIERIRPYVRPGSLVMDTCSVKMYPARLLETSLPSEIQVLATHPMFGPTSVEQLGAAGQSVVVCPVRVSASHLDMIEGWFVAMGLRIIRVSPEEHDRQAAVSQGLVHFIGRAVERAGFREQAISTANARRLFELTRSVTSDSEELFHDLETFNPFAEQVRTELLAALQRLDQSLRES